MDGTTQTLTMNDSVRLLRSSVDWLKGYATSLTHPSADHLKNEVMLMDAFVKQIEELTKHSSVL